MDFRIGILTMLLLTITVSIPSCVDIVEAEYNYQDNILFVDAYALTETGTSTVSINRSFWDGRSYSVRPVTNAKVRLENVDLETSVEFIESDSGEYLSPTDFRAVEGETWKLYIELEDGKKIESKAETVIAAIPIDDIRSEYSTEVIFDNSQDEFVPGHKVMIDWQDPAGQENYYLWKYKTYQPLYVCKTCIRGVLRNGACQANTTPFFPAYYDYLCEPVCWKLEYEEETIVFEDRLSDGATIQDFNLTILPFYRRPDILIEVQQLSLSKSTYDYFKVINDQVSVSGGLNAPPAAPLIGNLFNPDDPTDFILGQFTTAGVSSKSLFIDRSTIQEFPITPDPVIRLEPCLTCPKSYPCEESRNRTSIEPEGWQ